MNYYQNDATGHASVRKREPIAIVGMGCRFPGQVHSPEAYWQFLKQGGNAITDVPADRWPLEEFYDPDANKAGKIKNRKGGFLDNMDHFDAGFFGIFPKEAERIDPQQRLLLEVTYQALEDAGVKMEAISGSKTAVYMGVFMNDYWDIQTASSQREQISPHVPMGVSLTAIANRISYVYNLKGPSVTLDTACSSSLVGVHLACQSIWSGESLQALAGGVNLILRPESSIMMSKGNFLSPDGYCKSFDSRANGYVRSEGCGVVLLKPLAQAEADGDHIYATILGTAVNQDGHTAEGFTVPSYASQVEMLKTAYQQAGVAPEKVAYIEAHGTGTPVGDPIETRAFGEVIGKNRKEDAKCWIGSVKSNIGHLEAAAGVAGLIKLALVLKHKQIPQNLHFENPNPKIPFEEYKLRVPTRLETLPKNGAPVIGGVNSFGAGGTNAHGVLQEYIPKSIPHDPMIREEQEAVQLLTLSARSREALKANAGQFINYLEHSEASLKAICFSAATRRSLHEHRLAIAARSKKEVQEKLTAFLQEETRPGMTYHKKSHQENPKIGFIFSGQGPQWYAMGQQLLQSSPLFRATILKIDQLFARVADWSLLEEMNKDETHSRVSETRIAQPAIMAIQIALTALWKSWGVHPEGCIGHSIGEVAAAYAAGSLTLEQAVEVIYHRSRGQHQATDKGKMLAVGLTLEGAREAIKGHEDRVSIAAINGPQMVALSGDVEPLEAIASKLDAQDVFHRFLRVNVPFHSHHMEPLKEELIASLEHLVPASASVPLYSTVTGRQESGEHLVSTYWYRNVREPVYFTTALQQMIEDGFDTFVEVAPHPILTTGALELLKQNNKNEALIAPSLRRKEDEALTMMGSLGMLFAHGYKLDWQHLFGTDNPYVKLPAYAWQHEKYWFESRENAQKRLGKKVHPHLSGNRQSVTNPAAVIWDVQLDKAVHTYLEDHKVDGALIFPGTGHLEVAYGAAKTSFGQDFGFLEDIHFESALFLPEEGETPEIRLEVSSGEGQYYLCSRSRQEEEAGWTKHSRGKMNYTGDTFISRSVDLAEVQQRVNGPVSVANLYLELKECGLQYGDAFRCIQRLWKHDKEILAALKLDKSIREEASRFGFHPALLDACLHAIFAAVECPEGQRRGIYLPVHIDRFKVHHPSPKKVWSYIQVSEASEEFLKGDYWIMDETGQLIAEIQGLRCKYIEGSRGEDKHEVYRGMYAYQWELAKEAESQVPYKRVNGDATGGCVILADAGGVADEVLQRFHHDHLYPIVVEKGEAFQEVSNNHFTVDPACQQDIACVLQSVTAKGHKISRVMYLWTLDSRFDPDLAADALEQQENHLSSITLNFLRSVVAQGLEPIIHVVTQGVAEVIAGDSVNINQAAILGMGRVMVNEYPFIRLSLVDLSAEAGSDELDGLYHDFATVGIAYVPETALRGKERYIRKLEAVTQKDAEQIAVKALPALGSAYRAEVSAYGTLDSVVFRELRRGQPGDNEIEIEVRAAGLNFKDIMNVMGLLSEEAVAGGVAGKNLGLECAGVVTAVGKHVKEFCEGDEVMAWAANSFAGYTRAHVDCAVHKPAHLNFEEAATVTVVYLTAYYSLHYLGRISKGERVLIHAASGGVGVAAIKLAQLAGAEVLATAGNAEKRTFVRSLGVQHVFDSRSLQFADDVMQATAGKGVDIVLNSLSGKGIIQSIKCLAPFGRFIEIGKADIYNDAQLALKRFGNNLSYHAVDVDRLMLQKSCLGKQLYQQVASLFYQQKLSVHPCQVFPVREINEALKHMSKGVHIGKIVVNMERKESVEVLPPTQLVLDSKGTYLITGGASGFGLSLARWLVEKGARHLVLLSRSGCKSEDDQQMVSHMREQGAQVHLINADITREEEVQKIVQDLRASLPPLKGIIHSAAVLDDATIPNTDQHRFMRVFRPKALGAWNLHRATQEDQLDFFLMLSSISSIFGLPGQSNYAAANNFLDALACYRQSQGLAASSVNLGVLGNYAGMSKEGGKVLNVLANQGWLPLSLKQVTAKLENILVHKATLQMAANLDWKRFRDFFTHLQEDVRFTHFIQQAAKGGKNLKGGTSTLLDEIINAADEQKQSMLEDKLASALAKILGTSTDKIEKNVSIASIGLDSLMLNQLRNWIQQKLDINFPLMKIAKGPSLEELAAQLLMEMDAKGSKPAVSDDTSGIGASGDMEMVNLWLVRNRHNIQEVKRRIFCIHPVGAGASMFSHFLFNPPKNTDVLAFQLPGRENRSSEKPYEHMSVLIPEMAKAIEPLLDKPFIILGHSFGGIIGFELIRYLRKVHGVQPVQLFITGTIAPQLTLRWKERDVISQTAVETNSEDRLLALMNYIDDVEFLKRILPVMRKDMPLIMSYPYKEEGLFDFPISGFAADKDEVVLVEEVGAWKKQTSAQFTLEVVEGDHWFLSRNKELMLKRLTQAWEQTERRKSHQETLKV